MKTNNHRQGMRLFIAVILIALIGFIFSIKISPQTSVADQIKSASNVDTIATGSISKTSEILEDIDTSKLTALQLKILAIVKTEYAKSPKSYDKNVLKYTEGFKESWCADFISWVLNEAGSPNISNDTNYWRIPGVLSLQTYYEDADGYRTVNDDFTPSLGDVAFYMGAETPDGSSSEHAAFVLSFDGTTLVTIGGNEGDDGGVLRVRSETVGTNVTKGLVGYGSLD